MRREMHSNAEAEHTNLAARPEKTTLGRSDISRSLESLDDTEVPSRKERRQQRKQARRDKKLAHPRRRKIIKWSSIALVVILLAIAGFVVYKALFATSHVFKGNIFDAFQSKPLKEDANGRTNILVFGTSEDDPGHEAAYLTDSIMVLSVNQKAKDAYMFSIPRDLEVQFGKACLAGYSGKINQVYGCNYEDGANEEAGAKALQAEVSDVTGLDIQYYTHVNYSVVRDAVGAVGGIDIVIESRDPRGQMDGNFDWKCFAGDPRASWTTRVKNCPPSGHFIDYKNGPAHLDAEHALYLAQARGDMAPTYGFEQSNFDREKNQQKIVKALREKALSAGTLANPAKVVGLMDALGNNLRTNFEMKEINTLVGLAKDIPSEKIQSIVLNEEGDAILGGDGNPVAGRFKFNALRAFLAKKISSNPVVKEAAEIVILNATGQSGVAQKEADALEAKGYTIGAVDNAPEGTYGAVEIYQIGTGNTATADALKAYYGVSAIQTTPPPVAVQNGVSFVVVIGKVRS